MARDVHDFIRVFFIAVFFIEYYLIDVDGEGSLVGVSKEGGANPAYSHGNRNEVCG